MNSVYDKFIKFLDDYQKSLYLGTEKNRRIDAFCNGSMPPEIHLTNYSSEVHEEFVVLSMFLNFCNTSKEDIRKNNCVYINFDWLIYFTSLYGMAPSQYFDILIMIIEKSIGDDFFERPVLNWAELFNDNNYIVLPWKLRTGYEDVMRIVAGEAPVKKWNILEKAQIKRNAKELKKQDDSKIKENYRIIKECFIDKKNTYTIEDIDMICDAFLNLGVTRKIVDEIRKYLENRIKNRPVKKEKAPKKENPLPYAYKPNKRDDKKKKDSVFEWVAGCISTVNLKPKRYMSLEERIHVVAWLLKNGYKKQDIEEYFLRAFALREWDVPEKKLSISYQEFRPKLEYCAINNRAGLNEWLLNAIDNRISEYLRLNSEQGDGALGHALFDVLNAKWQDVYYDFGYEMAEAKKLLETNCVIGFGKNKRLK